MAVAGAGSVDVCKVKDVRALNCKLEKLVDMSCVEAVKAAEEKSKDAT